MPGRPQPVHAAPPVAVAPPPVANPLSQLLGGGASNSLFQSLQSALQGANTGRPAQPNLAAPPVQPPSNKAAPPMMVATSGRPDFRDPDSLKKPYASVISALYDDFKHRCSQCGLRFQEKAKLDDHLDWHFQQKRKEKSGVKKAFSRSWFVAANDWQQSKGGLISLVTMRQDGAMDTKGKSDEESSSDEKKPATVPADETQPNCAGCGEEFEQFHDDDTEQWLFNNAIKAPDGKIYHPQCYTPQTEGDEVRLARKRAHDEMTPSTDAVANGDDVSKKPRIE
jgi:pre-mRNA cleavage complex 2 protein Pcf11